MGRSVAPQPPPGSNAHGRTLADELPGAELVVLEQTGHEYFPPVTWEVVLPALLRHTARV